jgi:hypothetical protein
MTQIAPESVTECRSDNRANLRGKLPKKFGYSFRATRQEATMDIDNERHIGSDVSIIALSVGIWAGSLLILTTIGIVLRFLN